MAQRRMFSLKIVDTDAFLDMPQSSQLLYFHLSMRADDDGFVGNPKKITRMIGSQDDDFKVLIAKRFVIPFESGVCVIKHWLVHNLIRGDRYTETNYTDEKGMLSIKENKSYTERQKLNVIPNDNQTAPQVRLGKVRLDNNTASAKASAEDVSNDPMNTDEFIEWCRRSGSRHINIIGEYVDTKRSPNLTTRGQWTSFMKRNVRAAKALVPFTDEQLGEALGSIEKADYIKRWTLETLLKYIEE